MFSSDISIGHRHTPQYGRMQEITEDLETDSRQWSKRALLIADLQKDFCSGGSFEIDGAEEIVPVINDYIEHFRSMGGHILISRDWHPAASRHFSVNGGNLPIHCIQNSRGAEFHEDLDLRDDTLILSKGLRLNEDGHSATNGKDKSGRTLINILHDNGIKEVFVCGLTTDGCVRHTVNELLDDFRVFVLIDAIRGMNEHPQDSSLALADMLDNGVEVMNETKMCVNNA